MVHVYSQIICAAYISFPRAKLQFIEYVGQYNVQPLLFIIVPVIQIS